jgi:transcription elongation GreA/GreB family factor
MKALAFFIHLRDMLKEVKPEEWPQVSEAIAECESLIAAGKKAHASSTAPAQPGSHHVGTK